MEKSNFVTLAVISLILIGGALYTYTTIQKNRLSEKDSQATGTLIATDVTPYTDMEGNPFSFDQYRGKVRVVNSWASWCPFCVAELKDFQALAVEYQDADVAVIAINRKEPRERAKAFLGTVGTLDAIDFAIDLTDAYYSSIGGFSMPETVFYDAKGNITFHKRGFMNLQEMKKHTQDAINATE